MQTFRYSKSSAIFLTLVAAGCSQAGFEGYGPAGQGLVGSAYGYKERKISPESWDVSYTDTTAERARQGAERRAEELCQQINKSPESFSASLIPKDGIVTVEGVANCTEKVSKKKPTQNTEIENLQQRLTDIDTEIASLEQSISPNRIVPAGGFIAAGELIGGVVTKNQIQKLKTERTSTVQKLNSLGVLVTPTATSASVAGGSIGIGNAYRQGTAQSKGLSCQQATDVYNAYVNRDHGVSGPSASCSSYYTVVVIQSCRREKKIQVTGSEAEQQARQAGKAADSFANGTPQFATSCQR